MDINYSYVSSSRVDHAYFSKILSRIIWATRIGAALDMKGQ
jgi:hypothetical protein